MIFGNLLDAVSQIDMVFSMHFMILKIKYGKSIYCIKNKLDFLDINFILLEIFVYFIFAISDNM